MELYDSNYVYFDWDNNLEGKKGFFADNIDDLKQNVKDNRILWYGKIYCSNNPIYPFKFIDEEGNSNSFRFCYYDPYYEFRRAYFEGKQLQYKTPDGDWEDIVGEPTFLGDEYRIKPDEMFYAEYFENHIVKSHHPVPENVLFKSEREKEVDLFIDDSEYFEEIIKAAREGKTIQFKEFGVRNDPWKRCVGWDDLSQHDFVHYEYRIDECTECLKYNTCYTPGKRCKSYSTKVEYVPFDSVQELMDAWEKKSGVKFNHELAMPFIWIKNKQKNRVYLITDFLFEKAYNCDVGTEDENLKLTELFEDYTFLDGSIIGKVKEE